MFYLIDLVNFWKQWRFYHEWFKFTFCRLTDLVVRRCFWPLLINTDEQWNTLSVKVRRKIRQMLLDSRRFWWQLNAMICLLLSCWLTMAVTCFRFVRHECKQWEIFKMIQPLALCILWLRNLDRFRNRKQMGCMIQHYNWTGAWATACTVFICTHLNNHHSVIQSQSAVLLK